MYKGSQDVSPRGQTPHKPRTHLCPLCASGGLPTSTLLLIKGVAGPKRPTLWGGGREGSEELNDFMAVRIYSRTDVSFSCYLSLFAARWIDLWSAFCIVDFFVGGVLLCAPLSLFLQIDGLNYVFFFCAYLFLCF